MPGYSPFSSTIRLIANSLSFVVDDERGLLPACVQGGYGQDDGEREDKESVIRPNLVRNVD
jgi:hypothetical protein